MRPQDSWRTRPICIEFPDQGQFHILLYLKGLAEAIIRLGGEIYISSKAENINAIGASVNGYQVNASDIVVATNTPVNGPVTMHTKQFPWQYGGTIRRLDQQ